VPGDRVHGIDRDVGPRELRRRSTLGLEPQLARPDPRTRRVALAEHRAVGREEIGHAPQQHGRIAADADVPVEQQRGPPSAGRRNEPEHRAVEHLGAALTRDLHCGR